MTSLAGGAGSAGVAARSRAAFSASLLAAAFSARRRAFCAVTIALRAFSAAFSAFSFSARAAFSAAARSAARDGRATFSSRAFSASRAACAAAAAAAMRLEPARRTFPPSSPSSSSSAARSIAAARLRAPSSRFWRFFLSSGSGESMPTSRFTWRIAAPRLEYLLPLGSKKRLYTLPPSSFTQRTRHPGDKSSPVTSLARSASSAAASSSRSRSLTLLWLRASRALMGAAAARGRVGAEWRLSFPERTCRSTCSTTSALLENFFASGAKKRMRPTSFRLVALQLRSIATRQLAPSITPVSSNTCLMSSRRAAASSLENASSSMRSCSTCSGDFAASPSTATERRLKSSTCATMAPALSNRFPPGEKKRLYSRSARLPSLPLLCTESRTRHSGPRRTPVSAYTRSTSCRRASSSRSAGVNMDRGRGLPEDAPGVARARAARFEPPTAWCGAEPPRETRAAPGVTAVVEGSAGTANVPPFALTRLCLPAGVAPTPNPRLGDCRLEIATFPRAVSASAAANAAHSLFSCRSARAASIWAPSDTIAFGSLVTATFAASAATLAAEASSAAFASAAIFAAASAAARRCTVAAARRILTCVSACASPTSLFPGAAGSRHTFSSRSRPFRTTDSHSTFQPSSRSWLSFCRTLRRSASRLRAGSRSLPSGDARAAGAAAGASPAGGSPAVPALCPALCLGVRVGVGAATGAVVVAAAR